MIDFAPSNKPIMANKLFSFNLERFLTWIKSQANIFQSKCNEDCNFTVLNTAFHGCFSLKFFKFPIIKFHSLHKKNGCFASGTKCSDRVHRKKTTKKFVFFKLESFLSVVNKKTIKLTKKLRNRHNRQKLFPKMNNKQKTGKKISKNFFSTFSEL